MPQWLFVLKWLCYFHVWTFTVSWIGLGGGGGFYFLLINLHTTMPLWFLQVLFISPSILTIVRTYVCWYASGLSDWLEVLWICFPCLRFFFFLGWSRYTLLLTTSVCLVGIFIMAWEGFKKHLASETRRNASRGQVDKLASTFTSRARATPTTPAPEPALAPPAVQIDYPSSMEIFKKAPPTAASNCFMFEIVKPW